MSTTRPTPPALLVAISTLIPLAAVGVARLTRGRRRHEIPSTARSITVLGQGAVAVAPDQARIHVGIQARAPTAREASDRGTAAMHRVLTALTAQGVAERQIQTGYFNVMPEHYTGPDRSMDRRHAVHNTITATIPAIERVGAVLDAVIEAGGDEVMVNHVQLMIGDPAPAYADARRAALADAREQAEQIAREAGLALGDVVSIHPQQSNVLTQRMAARGMGHMARFSAAVPIEPGEMQVTAGVEVVYAIR